MSNLSDQQLIADYLKGDEKALEVLVSRYLKPIYSLAYRYAGNVQDAEDVSQEIFVKAWRHLKKFDRRRNFKTWIFSIAKNTCLDFLKKTRTAAGGQKTIPFAELATEDGGDFLAETIPDPSPLPQEALERAGLGETVAKAMEKLSPKQSLVLSLRYHNCFTFQEIAESLGESLNTVKSRHRRAILILKRLLSAPASAAFS